jgi:hypothetical protein
VVKELSQDVFVSESRDYKVNFPYEHNKRKYDKHKYEMKRTKNVLVFVILLFSYLLSLIR